MSKEVTIYWRPGCPFCTTLFRQLQAASIDYIAKNIYESKEDAQIVRSIANGNETVPTVVVGDKAMVNPSVAQIIALLG